MEKKRGGWGGRTPPFCKHGIFITRSEEVHMAPVFAGRMILLLEVAWV